MPDKQLSKNFKLSEFLRSRTAIKAGIDMTPPKAVEANLKSLVEKVLQPLREGLKSPVIITSGFRPKALNVRIGGARHSAHLNGRAADIYMPDHKLEDVAQWLMDNLKEEIDQVIVEHGEWIHVQIADKDKKPRQRILTAYREKGETKYEIGLKPKLYA